MRVFFWAGLSSLVLAAVLHPTLVLAGKEARTSLFVLPEPTLSTLTDIEFQHMETFYEGEENIRRQSHNETLYFSKMEALGIPIDENSSFKFARFTIDEAYAVDIFLPPTIEETVHAVVESYPAQKVLEQYAPPSGFEIIGNKVLEFRTYTTTEQKQIFGDWFTIEIILRPEELAFLDSTDVGVFFWNSDSQTWQEIQDVQADLSTGVVSFLTNHFSLYTILKKSASNQSSTSPPARPSASGRGSASPRFTQMSIHQSVETSDAMRISVEVPTDALPERDGSTRITPFPRKSLLKEFPLPKDTEIIGEYVYDIVYLVEGTIFSGFEKDVTITFEYPDIYEASVRPADLRVQYLNPKTRSWHIIKSAIIDPIKKTVTVKTKHFTIFALTQRTSDTKKEYPVPVDLIPEPTQPTESVTHFTNIDEPVTTHSEKSSTTEFFEKNISQREETKKTILPTEEPIKPASGPELKLVLFNVVEDMLTGDTLAFVVQANHDHDATLDITVLNRKGDMIFEKTEQFRGGENHSLLTSIRIDERFTPGTYTLRAVLKGGDAEDIARDIVFRIPYPPGETFLTIAVARASTYIAPPTILLGAISLLLLLCLYITWPRKLRALH